VCFLAALFLRCVSYPFVTDGMPRTHATHPHTRTQLLEQSMAQSFESKLGFGLKGGD